MSRSVDKSQYLIATLEHLKSTFRVFTIATETTSDTMATGATGGAILPPLPPPPGPVPAVTPAPEAAHAGNSEPLPSSSDDSGKTKAKEGNRIAVKKRVRIKKAWLIGLYAADIPSPLPRRSHSRGSG